MTVARRLPLSPRLWPILAVAGLGLGGVLYAQLAPGDRGVAPIDSSSNLEVGGVAVDVVGRDADTARSAGWREAQRKGWKMLWARVHGSTPAAAPGLPDSTLDSIVAGIEVEQEQAGPRRYVARLGVLFDRARAGQLLGVRGQAVRSAPMLVIPVMWSGGSVQSFEARTDWQKAWARFRAGTSAVDYVRPTGNGADPVLLNIGQARRPGRGWWRMLLDQYGAADVLVVEAYVDRLFPGGPVRARFVGRHGPDGQVLAVFAMNAATYDDYPRMLDRAVLQLDAAFIAALREGRLTPDPSLVIEEPEVLAPPPELAGEDAIGDIIAGLSAQSYTIQVETPDAATLAQVEAALRGVPGVASTRVSSLAVGGTSVMAVAFTGEIAMLRLGLAARGWRLDEAGGALVLHRQAGTPQPAPAAPNPAPTPQ